MIDITARLKNPPIQALTVFVVSSIFMLAVWALRLFGWMEIDVLTPWLYATSFLLFFAILNSLMSIKAPSFTKYWGQSVYSFMGLAFMNAMVARLLTGVSIGEAGSYKSIFIVITIGFLIFLSMLNAIKGIVGFAEKEEWNAPKTRNRK